MASVVALILALAKALPLLERMVAMIEERRREAKAAELHDAIDQGIADARNAAAVCPRPDRPLLRGRVCRTSAPADDGQ